MTISTIPKSNYTNFRKLGNIYIVSFNAEEVNDNFITCTQTTIKLNKHMSYEQIVAKLIRVRYTSDEEMALINNALLDLSNIANNDEYNEYQSWRTKCKEAAKQYLNKNEEVK